MSQANGDTAGSPPAAASNTTTTSGFTPISQSRPTPTAAPAESRQQPEFETAHRGKDSEMTDMTDTPEPPVQLRDESLQPTAEAIQRSQPTNGFSAINAEGADDTNDDALSSPPDSIMGDDAVMDTTSGSTAPNGANLHDSPDNIDTDEAEMDAGRHSPSKRKRISLYEDMDEDKMDLSLMDEEAPLVPQLTGTGHAAEGATMFGLKGKRGVIIGYWRQSDVANVADRHVVIGFIDIRDRLRTRLYNLTRSGKDLTRSNPLPPGPGGSWVTFTNVVFEPHLVGLNHHEVKEFVKIRADDVGKMETPEEAEAKNLAAVQKAIKHIQDDPPPEGPQPVQIAYGTDLPARLANKQEPKRRRTGTAINGEGTSNGTPLKNNNILPAPNGTNTPNRADSMAPPGAGVIHPLDHLPGTRPTKILVGYWKGSSELNPADKHAVFGILGANDMMRVKVSRETRDGRVVNGNFPSGAGALWLHWDEVEFEPHIKHLTRPEIKEYLRVRQFQLDQGENPNERLDNETKAVYQAQTRVVQSAALPTAAKKPMPLAPQYYDDYMSEDHDDDYKDNGLVAGGNEPRPARRQLPGSRDASRPTRHALPNAATSGVIERANSIARREIARAEQVQLRNDQRAATREAITTAQPGHGPALSGAAPLPSRSGSGTPADNRMQFSENVGKLNKIWEAQETNRLKAGVEDAKIYAGVKYERKATGPFQGKLVSQGTIISIDGEDYVEYRVLTKPSFF